MWVPKGAILAVLIVLSMLEVRVAGVRVEVWGVVVDEQGKGIPNVLIEAYQDDTLVDRCFTSERGRFVLSLGRGPYTLVFSKRGYEERSLKVLVGDEPVKSLGDVLLRYALSISMEALSVAVEQGAEVNLSVRVLNRGSYDERAEVVVLAPPGWDAGLYTRHGLEVLSLSLPPGECRDLVLSVSVPRNASGIYNVTLLLKGGAEVGVTVTFHVKSKDWKILSTRYTILTGFRGEILKAPVRITNTLGKEASITLSIRGPRGWDFELVDSTGKLVRGVKLAPAEEMELTLKVRIPESASEGVHNVTITADADGARSVLQVSIRVMKGYDMIKLESESPSVGVYPGSTAKIPIKIINEGVVPTVVHFNVSGLPRGFTYYVEERNRGVITSIYLQPSESRDLILNVDVPQDVMPGALSFELVALGKRSEASLVLGLTVLGRYELSLLTTNFYVSGVEGTRVKFPLVVKNTGFVEMRDLRVVAHDVPPGIRVDVEPEVVERLLPGETARFVISIDPKPGTPPGFYNIPVTVAATGVRKERIIKLDLRPRGGSTYLIIIMALILVVVLVAAYRRLFYRSHR